MSWLQVVLLLIERGADVNPRDSQGNTPLHFASQNGHMESTTLLLFVRSDTAILHFVRQNDTTTDIHFVYECDCYSNRATEHDHSLLITLIKCMPPSLLWRLLMDITFYQ